MLNKNTKTKLILIVNLLLILSLMTFSVYSWFVVNVENNVNAYEIEVVADNALELSFTGADDDWSTALNLADLEDEDGNLVLSSMKFTEVTGDGEKFLIPALSQNGTYALPNTEVKWNEAQANVNYLQFTVKMRSKDPLYVFLSSESKASPVAGTLTGTNCDNPTEYGNKDFSKDCIVGALRVAYDVGSVRNVWITNPKIHLKNQIGTSVYSMDTNVTSSTAYPESTNTSGGYYVWNNSYEHWYYNESKALVQLEDGTDVKVRTSLPDTINDIPGSESLLTQLTKKTTDAEFYTGEATFTVWIEGCDTEARRALVGGKLKLSLVFDSNTFISE